MPIVPYLHFDGTCREAVTRYAEIFGGTVEIFTFGEGPPEYVTDANRDRVMHASVTLPDGAQVFCGDAPEGYWQPMQGFHVSVGVDDAGEARRIYDALREGGTVQMALDKTFWAQAFAMLVDRWGAPWMINCD